MSPGAKVFLTLAGIGGIFGVLAIAATKKSSAAPLPGTVVVPPKEGDPPQVTEPESGFDREGPFAVPGIQDAQEASRHLLRWWATEGQSLVASDTAADRPNAPADFGSRSEDLSGAFGPRTQKVAAAFEHYNGLTPEDGVLSNPLLLALRRWASSQALPPEALPPRNTPQQPTLPPIVLPVPPSPSGQAPSSPPFVPLPPIAPQNPPIVPVPPVIPDPGAPTQPPVVFVPPVAPSNPAPPGPVPVPPVLVPSLPPIAAPQPAQTPPTAVDKATAFMVNALLTAEAKGGWNKVEPSVQAWQKERGLVVDGKFGPKSALAVAEEFGTVPIVRFWPKGSQKAQALQAYRTALIEIANHTSDTTRAAQLRVTAQREQAQSFGVLPGKAAALPSSLQVQLEKVA